MPELPEVETIRRGLAPHMTQRRIVQAEARRANLRFPFPQNFAKQLEGAQITEVARRAKYLLVHLADRKNGTRIWLTHLGMTGRFTVHCTPDRNHRYGKHDHFIIGLDDGTRIVYSDPRRFGYMDLCAATDLQDWHHLRGLGAEPLSADFSPHYLAARLAGRNTSIKSALLDQRVVAGLGNIYVCEALYRAKVSPRCRAGGLRAERVARLAHAICAVLQDALKAGGSTLRDFATADGTSGYFQHKFDVYGRADEPCLRASCNAKIKRIVQAGRSSFYCGACQK